MSPPYLSRTVSLTRILRSYYINPPGVGDEGCIWGDSSKPIGNWAPYVAGANTDKSGQTFVKLGFNPIFEFEGAGLEKNPLTFGVKIECPGGGCNGLPCELNPAKKGLGDVVSNQSAVGAGGSSFCVVTVPSGSKANIVVFNTDGSSGGNNNKDKEKEKPQPQPQPETTKVKEEPSPSSTADAPSSSAEAESESTTEGPSSSTRPTVKPGIFLETDAQTSNSPSTQSSDDSAPTSADSTPTESQSNENEAPGLQQGSAAVAGLVVALAAAAVLY